MIRSVKTLKSWTLTVIRVVTSLLPWIVRQTDFAVAWFVLAGNHPIYISDAIAQIFALLVLAKTFALEICPRCFGDIASFSNYSRNSIDFLNVPSSID